MYDPFDASRFDAFDTSEGVVIHYLGDSYTLLDVTRADLSAEDFLLI